MYTIIVEFNCDETHTYASDFDGLFDLIFALNLSEFVKRISVLEGNTIYLPKDFNWSNLIKWNG